MKTTKVRVVGIEGPLNDLVCEVITKTEKIRVDPFVRCAMNCEQVNPTSLLGKIFEMDYDLVSESGVYLPSIFKEVTNE